MGNVYITGIGIVSSLGVGIEETISKITRMESGLKPLSILDSCHKGELLVGEIGLTDVELRGLADCGKDIKLSRTSLLALIAVRQALKNYSKKDLNSDRTGLISGTSVGGMHSTEQFFEDYLKDKTKGDLSKIFVHECADSTAVIKDVYDIKDFVTTISTACSSSANAIMLGARLIKHDVLDRVIVGGSDSLCKFTINGFNTLLILDKSGCKPFDDKRAGITLGEGSAYLVLESDKLLKKFEKKALCKIQGWGNACDAYHQTASSPEGNGAYLAMKKALQVSELDTSEIDYINAHGTGTKNNDLSEGIAIERLFTHQIPYLSSTKGFTGHTLGASGSIEAVLSVLAINNNMLFPNLGFKNKMSELSFSPVDKLVLDKKITNILSNSFGFGGNNTSLIFSRC